MPFNRPNASVVNLGDGFADLSQLTKKVNGALRDLADWTVNGPTNSPEVRQFLADNLTGQEFTFTFSFDTDGLDIGFGWVDGFGYPEHAYEMTAAINGDAATLTMQKITRDEVEAR